MWGRRVDAWVSSQQGTSAVRQVAMIGLVILVTALLVWFFNSTLD